MQTEPSSMESLEAPQGLFEVVLKRIEREERRHLRRRRILGSFLLIGSLATLVPAVISFATDITESGFAQYFSLAFSDSDVVARYWQDFSLALLESLPLMSTSLVLVALLGLLISLRNVFTSRRPVGAFISS